MSRGTSAAHSQWRRTTRSGKPHKECCDVPHHHRRHRLHGPQPSSRGLPRLVASPPPDRRSRRRRLVPPRRGAPPGASSRLRALSRVAREGTSPPTATVVGEPHDQEGSASVLIGGDAGVGKTRLLLALRDRAVAAGRLVVVGHSLDFGDSALPYLP